MDKPRTKEGYDDGITAECVRVLVTLLRGLGPWKESVYLVGGLAPKYIIEAAPPEVPEHAGTLDVDLVIDQKILEETEAYKTLEKNLKRIGFERATNDAGSKLSWRWQIRTDKGHLILLEFLVDAPGVGGGRVEPLPAKGRRVSALNVPHASLVFDFHGESIETAELLGENGIVEERIRHANIVSFLCLKAFAFEDRYERKDAYDLNYCLEHAAIDAVTRGFRSALEGRRRDEINAAVDILRRRFVGADRTRSHLLDGPVAVAKFELGEENASETRERRVLRQREVSSVIASLLDELG
ncbi:MAG TPA: antitoxin [Planctomycetes bacterium]|nr:antitoxin [Planctomycetota bacterium]